MRKHAEQAGTTSLWDEWLPWLALGYRASTQASTGFSPYYLLHGVHPVVPPAYAERFEAPLNFENGEQVARVMQRRAHLIQEAGVIAGNNLLLAQRRDEQRYALARSGSHTPATHTHQPGDFVYLRRLQKNNTLDMPVHPEVLQVVSVSERGLAELRGQEGASSTEHVTRLLPCGLPPTSAEAAGPSRGQCRPSAQAAPLPEGPGAPAGPSWPVSVAPGGPEGVLFPTRRQRQADEAARAMHGRVIAKEFGPARRSGTFYGRVHFLGERERPWYFGISYIDGDRETMNLHQLQPLLLSDAQLKRVSPAKVPALGTYRATDEVVLVAHVRALPDCWDLTSPSGVSQALSLLMPGSNSPGHITRLARLLAADSRGAALLRSVPTLDAEVQALLAALDFSRCGLVFDPWSGTGAVARAVRQLGLRAVSNDLNPAYAADLHADALQPALYHHVRRAYGRIDAAVFSPWFAYLDLAVPLAVAFAAYVVCVHVPGGYLTDARPARQAWLRQLQRAGRLHIITGLPAGPMGRRCVWLCIFADSAVAARMMRFTDTLPYLMF